MYYVLTAQDNQAKVISEHALEKLLHFFENKDQKKQQLYGEKLKHYHKWMG